MFPYPSGRIHMGHVRNYSIGDVVARYKRMRGFNVLHPMGWDAFGLPAENAAIERGVHPETWTQENILYMKTQLQRMGLSYDWEREIATCEPEYYRWNQWIFLQFFKKGLAYKKSSFVNWCPSCETVLANEQVIDGACWRCDSAVVQKELEQWFFRITDYAEELLRDLDKLDGWPDKVLTMQRNWIGKSSRRRNRFSLDRRMKARCAFLRRGRIRFLARRSFPSRSNIRWRSSSRVGTAQEAAVRAFIERIQKYQPDQPRRGGRREKEGVFTGAYCRNPFTGENIPIYLANFVLMEYGTGAVMAVPAHDQRDFEFAKKYDLPIRVVIQPHDREIQPAPMTEAYVDEGVMVDSGSFSGLANIDRQGKDRRLCRGKRDGARKRFAIVCAIGACRASATGARRFRSSIAIAAARCRCRKTQLPVLLPKDVPFTGKGGSPLAESKRFSRSRLSSVRRPSAPRNRYHGHFRRFVVVFFALHVGAIYRGAL